MNKKYHTQKKGHNALRITGVEENISLVKHQILSNSEVLATLQKELKANIDTMKENMKLVDKRVQEAIQTSGTAKN